jgi:branched-subunit amino acid ABC-type transport system permease component
MMNQIKHGVSFLLGALYTSLIWLMLKDLGWNAETWILLMTLAMATILIAIMIIKFFITHWRKR